METLYFKLTLLACCLLTLVSEVASLQCYECTSYPPDREHSEPKDLGEECMSPLNTTTTPVPLVECKESQACKNYSMEHNETSPSLECPRCFKVTTYGSGLTENRKMEVVHTMVSRFCGVADYGDKCWNNDGQGADTETCVCDGDGCNPASLPSYTGFGLLALLAATVLTLSWQ